MKPYLAFGGILTLIGAALFYTPVLLPRSWFGELGHGDGMGLIGFALWGAVIAGVGFVVNFGRARLRSVHSQNERD